MIVCLRTIFKFGFRWESVSLDISRHFLGKVLLCDVTSSKLQMLEQPMVTDSLYQYTKVLKIPFVILKIANPQGQILNVYLNTQCKYIIWYIVKYPTNKQIRGKLKGNATESQLIELPSQLPHEEFRREKMYKELLLADRFISEMIRCRKCMHLISMSMYR